MTRWEKLLWTVLAGAAFSTASCGSPTLYGVPPPGDSSTDVEVEADNDTVDDVLEDGIDDMGTDEMIAGAYGPPPDM